MNEAELLFTEVLNCSRLSLYLNREIPLGKVISSPVSAALRRRITGEPIQYILGKTEFFGLEFKVNKDVLIPRPETEILVETAINKLSAVSLYLSALNILELGTGSGCVAVSLAKCIKNAQIAACDISSPALAVAKENAGLHNVNIDFLQSDLFNAYSLQLTAYDLIISNPPYIRRAEINLLAPEVQYEPKIALDGGRDGLEFYRRIINDSPKYLKKSGLLILEIGYNQKDCVYNIFKKSKRFNIVEVVKDHSNINRVIVARENG